jgi:putative phage-type endonuclease
MNTKNLTFYPTLSMTREQWLDFREPMTHVKKFIQQYINLPEGRSQKTFEELKIFFSEPTWKLFNFPCIGSSEAATVLGLNPYHSIIELYFEKVGIKPTYREDNIHMFWGKALEDEIADKWQYWEGSPESVVENFNKKNIIRRCRKMNAYAVNKTWPWLFTSVDRIINKTATAGEGTNECKTIQGWVSQMWENGIPPMYVIQLQDQILVLELEFGEMTILKDGRFFEVYPFDKAPNIQERIKEQTYEFYSRVKAGIEFYILSRYTEHDEEEQQLLALVDNYSPEPDGSVSYRDYLNKTYDDKGIEMKGGPEELVLAKDYVYFLEMIKKLEVCQLKRSNLLKGIMKEANTMLLPEGKVTWKANAKQSRTFRVGVKYDPDYIADLDDEERASIVQGYYLPKV